MRYPTIQVAVRSRNPLALVSAVRHALRRAGVDPGQIALFSAEALAASSPERMARVCSDWVAVSEPQIVTPMRSLSNSPKTSM